MAEHVILVVGPMGAGKTTAISALSDIDTIRTEAVNTERDVVDKATTTVALDYGEIELSPNEKIRLYGVPGQKRFDFMWSILKQRAVGMIVLVKNDAEDPVGDLVAFFDEFREIHERGGVVVGITHSDLAPRPTTYEYQQIVAERYPSALAPVFTVDPRSRDQLVVMLSVLAANVDSRAMFLAR
ncbi:MAG: ATP/GTP-binding protein [Microbacteriaceae bacterium]|nr:ATP/GTP-binding protein [Microbacteriaceae bacterium]